MAVGADGVAPAAGLVRFGAADASDGDTGGACDPAADSGSFTMMSGVSNPSPSSPSCAPWGGTSSERECAAS